MELLLSKTKEAPLAVSSLCVDEGVLEAVFQALAREPLPPSLPPPDPARGVGGGGVWREEGREGGYSYG